MKKRNILPGVIVTMLLAACQWDSPVTKQTHDINSDTLSFKYDTLKKRAADCGNKADSTCTVAKVVYPVFEKDSALNKRVESKLVGTFGSDNPDRKPATSLQELIDTFISRYETDKKTGNMYGRFYTLDQKAKIVRQDSSLTTIQLDGYNYAGGAHGASFTSFVNWNTKSDHDLRLSDILTDGYQSKLTAVADTLFRQQEKLAINASLKDNYFFKNDTFALPQNFLITPLGLRFLYNQYEIKPYAAGQTELDIPYSKIKTLLRPNTVITQYLK